MPKKQSLQAFNQVRRSRLRSLKTIFWQAFDAVSYRPPTFVSRSIQRCPSWPDCNHTPRLAPHVRVLSASIALEFLEQAIRCTDKWSPRIPQTPTESCWRVPLCWRLDAGLWKQNCWCRKKLRKNERRQITRYCQILGNVQQFQQSVTADKDTSKRKIRCAKQTVVRKLSRLRPLLQTCSISNSAISSVTTNVSEIRWVHIIQSSFQISVSNVCRWFKLSWKLS